MCNFRVDACRPPGGPDIICENDGYCIPNQSDQGWECLCKQDFYGKNCETRKYYLLLIIIFVTILLNGYHDHAFNFKAYSEIYPNNFS